MLRSYEYVNLADIIAIAFSPASTASTFPAQPASAPNTSARAVWHDRSERSCDFMPEKTRASSPGSFRLNSQSNLAKFDPGVYHDAITAPPNFCSMYCFTSGEWYAATSLAAHGLLRSAARIAMMFT